MQTLWRTVSPYFYLAKNLSDYKINRDAKIQYADVFFGCWLRSHLLTRKHPCLSRLWGVGTRRGLFYRSFGSRERFSLFFSSSLHPASSTPLRLLNKLSLTKDKASGFRQENEKKQRDEGKSLAIGSEGRHGQSPGGWNNFCTRQIGRVCREIRPRRHAYARERIWEMRNCPDGKNDTTKYSNFSVERNEKRRIASLALVSIFSRNSNKGKCQIEAR